MGYLSKDNIVSQAIVMFLSFALFVLLICYDNASNALTLGMAWFTFINALIALRSVISRTKDLLQ